MFINLMKIWSEQAFSSEIAENFLFMLDTSEEMLLYAFRSLTKDSKGKKFQKKIYNKDKVINLKEQNIRKQILIHLAANPSGNIPACLALLIIVKDAERIGDYVKNLFELSTMVKGDESRETLFNKLFGDIGDELLALFKKVSESFKKSNKILSDEAVNEGWAIAKKCEAVINEVVKSKFSARQAVVLTLGARYIKRIALHLSNIASSVNNPMDQTGFIKND
ncbi:PhoU domain-containing protein [Candidatus Latescibacterota bacterium]